MEFTKFINTYIETQYEPTLILKNLMNYESKNYIYLIITVFS